MKIIDLSEIHILSFYYYDEISNPSFIKIECATFGRGDVFFAWEDCYLKEEVEFIKKYGKINYNSFNRDKSKNRFSEYIYHYKGDKDMLRTLCIHSFLFDVVGSSRNCMPDSWRGERFEILLNLYSQTIKKIGHCLYPTACKNTLSVTEEILRLPNIMFNNSYELDLIIDLSVKMFFLCNKLIKVTNKEIG